MQAAESKERTKLVDLKKNANEEKIISKREKKEVKRKLEDRKKQIELL